MSKQTEEKVVIIYATDTEFDAWRKFMTAAKMLADRHAGLAGAILSATAEMHDEVIGD